MVDLGGLVTHGNDIADLPRQLAVGMTLLGVIVMVAAVAAFRVVDNLRNSGRD